MKMHFSSFCFDVSQRWDRSPGVEARVLAFLHLPGWIPFKWSATYGCIERVGTGALWHQLFIHLQPSSFPGSSERHRVNVDPRVQPITHYGRYARAKVESVHNSAIPQPQNEEVVAVIAWKTWNTSAVDKYKGVYPANHTATVSINCIHMHSQKPLYPQFFLNIHWTVTSWKIGDELLSLHD